ncbi:hypothetical protein B0J12DRAFT_445265 [Macrophomina phaseolina]|uniref:BZIP transcription factor n=1 Tax=Macrophomina phaseolina TaxID=35725 RepID=A0ABQ8FQM6_9PEZI|nr:hypothetical protein B0J12DRAFT_445265 [Macrophomina phaseolina]
MSACSLLTYSCLSPAIQPAPLLSITRTPKLGRRKSSGTIIIPRDNLQVELGDEDEEYDENDARTMSPRRTSEEIEKISQEARQALIQQTKALQASLLSIVDHVESLRRENEKLQRGNRFLQSYVASLQDSDSGVDAIFDNDELYRRSHCRRANSAASATKQRSTKGRPAI